MIRFPFQRNKETPVVEPNTEPSYTDSLYDRGLRLMRDNRLRRLLDARHRVYTEELDLLGIRFTGRWFILVLVKETRSLQNAEGQKDDLYRNICRTMDETLQDRAMRSWTVLDSGDVYSIVNFDSEHPELQRIKIIDVVEMALSMLRDTEDAQLRGYVSELGECPEDIPKLHQSLAFLSDYERLIQEDGLVLTYDRLSAARHQNLHQDGLRSMEETQRFFTAITQENYREAKAAMNELISSLLREVDITVMPLGLVKARLGYLINLLDIGVDYIRLRVDQAIFSDMFPRLDFRECENVVDLARLSDQIFGELIQRVQDTGDHSYALSWVSDLKRYIDLYYTNPSMNVSFMADKFDLNAAYMSRVFRAKVGVSIPDYIQEVRLRRAKRELSADATVTEAAERSGFGSVRSMNRAFQKTEGLTPGKYRSQSADNSTES